MQGSRLIMKRKMIVPIYLFSHSIMLGSLLFLGMSIGRVDA